MDMFWIYLMSDCLIFAALFATFGVLVDSTAGGPGGKELFGLPFVLGETVLLLISSFTFDWPSSTCTPARRTR
jgi:cytochrome o ubiquinol oxidase subunit 3